MRANRSHLISLVYPGSACIIDSVTISASEIIRVIHLPWVSRNPMRVVLEQVIGTGIHSRCKGVRVGVPENFRFDVG